MPTVGDVEVYLPPTVVVNPVSAPLVEAELTLPPTVVVTQVAQDAVLIGIVSGGDIPPIVTSNAGFQAVNGATTLGGNRLVTVGNDGFLKYADCMDATHTGRPVGMTTGAISPSATAFPIIAGFVDESSWTWTPGEELFLGANGLPVRYASLPGGRAFELHIGAAVTATRIQLNVANSPIVR